MGRSRLAIMCIAFAALFSIISCSSVFDASISGTVRDPSKAAGDSASGIGGVMVYAYRDKAEWERKFSEWQPGTIFSDNSVPSAKSAADGSFSISTLRWETSNPAYGKDADRTTVYLLAFKKEYGLVKVDGRIVQSDKANNFGYVDMNMIARSRKVTVSFVDADDASSSAGTIADTDGFAFRYTYNDGYEDITEYVSSVSNGTHSVTMSYVTSSSPELRISEISTGSEWKYAGSGETLESGSGKDYIRIKCQNQWETKTVNVNLLDGSVSSYPRLSDPIDFTYSYSNGDGETKTDTITAQNGSASFIVRYRKDAFPSSDLFTVELSGFSSSGSREYWTRTKGRDDGAPADSAIVVSGFSSASSKSVDVYFKKKAIRLDGFNGYFISVPGSERYIGSDSDNGKIIQLFKGSEEIARCITGRKTVNPGDSSIIINGSFSGLGAGIELKLTYSDSDNSKYTSNNIELTLKSGSDSIGTIKFNSASVMTDADLRFMAGEVAEYDL